MSVTSNGNNIQRSFIGSYNLYLQEVKGFDRLYDNGYTAAYYNHESLVTFCEGDLAVITGENLEQEKADHLKFYRDNN